MAVTMVKIGCDKRYRWGRMKTTFTPWLIGLVMMKAQKTHLIVSPHARAVTEPANTAALNANASELNVCSMNKYARSTKNRCHNQKCKGSYKPLSLFMCWHMHKMHQNPSKASSKVKEPK
jgi:hypothetical protein